MQLTDRYIFRKLGLGFLRKATLPVNGSLVPPHMIDHLKQAVFNCDKHVHKTSPAS